MDQKGKEYTLKPNDEFGFTGSRLFSLRLVAVKREEVEEKQEEEEEEDKGQLGVKRKMEENRGARSTIWQQILQATESFFGCSLQQSRRRTHQGMVARQVRPASFHSESQSSCFRHTTTTTTTSTESESPRDELE